MIDVQFTVCCGDNVIEFIQSLPKLYPSAWLEFLLTHSHHIEPELLESGNEINVYNCKFHLKDNFESLYYLKYR